MYLCNIFYYILGTDKYVCCWTGLNRTGMLLPLLIHVCMYNLLITKSSASLVVPRPNLLTAVIVTVTLAVNSPTGSDGAGNNSTVVGLLTFIFVPL